MDYRYETKNEAREFHKQRTAFIIYENKIEFIEKVRYLTLNTVNLKA